MPEHENMEHTVAFITGANGELRISVDAPGERAVSAPVGDPIAFLLTFASQADLEVDDSQNVDGRGPVTVSVPAEK